MIPVVDVYFVLELGPLPDSDAISFDEEHDVDDDEEAGEAPTHPGEEE